MNYKGFVVDALESIGLPTAFQVYTGAATTYITFFCYDQQDTEYAENDTIATTYYLQVDLWSKSGDIDDLGDQIVAAMLSAGCKFGNRQDFYESDTKIFHKAMRFNFLDEGDI